MKSVLKEPTGQKVQHTSFPARAKRRRERRLRSMLRHERQTVYMELAAALHHSCDGGRETNYRPRAPKTERPGVLADPEPQGQERPRPTGPLLHLRALQEQREE